MRRWILVCGLVATVPLIAVDAQSLIPSGQGVSRKSGKGRGNFEALSSASRQIDVRLIESILNSATLNGFKRDTIFDELVEVLASGKANVDVVSQLLTRAQLATDNIPLAAQTLLQSIRARSEPLRFLASTTAAGKSDRLYGNVEALRYEYGPVAIRLLTSAAVSNVAPENADSLSREELDLYRNRTAAVLTSLQDGGPFAAHVSGSWRYSWGQPVFVDLGFNTTVAQSGTAQNPGSGLIGGEMELRAVAQGLPKRTNPTPQSLALLIRAGYRHGKELVPGIEQKNLSFIQLVAEGTVPSSKVPIGFSITRVRQRDFQPFVTKFQVFGSAGL